MRTNYKLYFKHGHPGKERTFIFTENYNRFFQLAVKISVSYLLITVYIFLQYVHILRMEEPGRFLEIILSKPFLFLEADAEGIHRLRLYTQLATE